MAETFEAYRTRVLSYLGVQIVSFPIPRMRHHRRVQAREALPAVRISHQARPHLPLLHAQTAKWVPHAPFDRFLNLTEACVSNRENCQLPVVGSPGGTA